MHQPRRGRSSSRNRVGQVEEDDPNPFYSEEVPSGSGASNRPSQVASASNISHVEAAPQSEHERNAISAIRDVMPAISVHEVQPGGGSATQTQPAQSNATAASFTPQSSSIRDPSATSAGHRAGHSANVQLVPPDAQIRELLAGDGVYHFNPETFQRFLEFERLQKITQQTSRALNQPRNSEPTQQVSTQAARVLPTMRSGTTDASTSEQHSTSQPRSSVSAQTNHDEIVHISSSSSEEQDASRPQAIITLHDTPHQSPDRQRTTHEDSSDDIPLIQRANRTSRGNSDEGSGTSSRGRSRVSWQEVQVGYSGTRCPVCGVTYQDPDEHNPFLCKDRNDGFSRSEAERQWMLDFSALARAWRGRAPQREQQPPIPNCNLHEAGTTSTPSHAQASTQETRTAATISRSQISTHPQDMRNLVRRDEQRARSAGVVHLGGDAQDRRDAREDAALESAHSSDGQSVSGSSSSWYPTSSESSLSSYQQHHRDMKSMQQAMAKQSAQMEQQRADFQTAMVRMQEQHLHFMQQLQMQAQAPPFPQQAPMFMPPYGFIPNGPPVHPAPNVMLPMAAPAYPQPQEHGPSPYQGMQPQWAREAQHQHLEDSISGSIPSNSTPQFHPMAQYPSHERIQFQPAAHHVEHAGMAGAPELPADQLGKASEFQKHVKVYNAYAMKAVSKGETHLSLAQTMSKYAFALSTAFTSQNLKRYRLAPHTFKQGDSLQITPRMVMEMSDDLFNRLYTESCSITIEDPSQVYATLSKLEYIRKTPEEDGPLPALMRAEAAFRSKLALLPQHAVSRCRPQELRDAFIKMVFTEARFDTMKLDFQQCSSWEHVYQQLMYRVGSSSSWYSEIPGHKTTPEVSISSNVSSSSPAQPGAKAEDKTEAGKQASAAYWKDLFAKLQKGMRFDPAILEGATTDKRRAKILQKLKFRQTLESEIRDQFSKAYQQQQRSRDPRDHSNERGGRPYERRQDSNERVGRPFDRRHESPHRDERSSRHSDSSDTRYQPRQHDSGHQRDAGSAGGSARPYDKRNQSPRGATPQPAVDNRQTPASPGRPHSQQPTRQNDVRPSRSPSAGRDA
jgi:hypothetical protein